MKCYSWVLFCCLLIARCAYAQESQNQEPQKGSVTIPLGYYEKLLKKVEGTLHMEQAPPLDFIIAMAVYNVTATFQKTEVSVEYTVEVLGNKWSKVPLIASSVPIKSVSVEEKSASLMVENEQYALLFPKPGQYKATVSFLLPSLYTSKAVHLDVSPAAITNMNFTIPKDRALSIKPGQIIESKEDGDVTQYSVQIPPTQKIEMALIEKVSQKQITSKKARLDASLITLISVGEGLMKGQTKIEFQIRNSGVDSFALDIPSTVLLNEISGNTPLTWKEALVAEDKKKHIVCKLEDFVQEKYTLTLDFEQKLENISAVAQIPFFSIVDADKQQGSIGVVARTNVEVKTKDSQNITVIDPQELSDEIYRSSTFPILLAFRYKDSTQTSLTIEIKRYTDIPVQVANVDSVDARTLVTEHGPCVTRYVMYVCNNRKQFVKLQLPKNSRVLSTSLSGRPVKPTMDEQERILVPLQKSTDVSKTISIFEVEIVFITLIEKMGVWGREEFMLPVADIPIVSLEWSLYLPLSMEYFGIGGNMREGSRGFYVPSATTSWDKPPEKANTSRANTSQSNYPSIFKYVDENTATGALPVQITIPKTGIELTFSKTMVLDQPPPLISVYFVHGKGKDYLYWILTFSLLFYLYRKSVTNLRARKKPGRMNTLVICILIGMLLAVFFLNQFFYTYLGLILFIVGGFLFYRYIVPKIEKMAAIQEKENKDTFDIEASQQKGECK